MNLAYRFGLLLGAVAALATATPSQAGISSVELSIAPGGVLGDYAQKYRGLTGFGLTGWWDSLKIGKQTRLLTTVRYMPIEFRGSPEASVRLINVMAGFATWGSGANFGLNPTFALQAGAAFSWLDVTGATGGIQNQAAYMVLDLAPGLEYPIYGPVTLTWQMAANLTFNRPTLVVLNQVFGIRWSL
jgi:hypothetical protein